MQQTFFTSQTPTNSWHIGDNLSNALGAWVTSQHLIPRAEQSGLWTRTEATGKRFVVRADEKLTAFMELEAAIRRVRLQRHRPLERHCCFREEAKCADFQSAS
jgi:hypothetical protein